MEAKKDKHSSVLSPPSCAIKESSHLLALISGH